MAFPRKRMTKDNETPLTMPSQTSGPIQGNMSGLQELFQGGKWDQNSLFSGNQAHQSNSLHALNCSPPLLPDRPTPTQHVPYVATQSNIGDDYVREWMKESRQSDATTISSGAPAFRSNWASSSMPRIIPTVPYIGNYEQTTSLHQPSTPVATNKHRQVGPGQASQLPMPPRPTSAVTKSVGRGVPSASASPHSSNINTKSGPGAPALSPVPQHVAVTRDSSLGSVATRSASDDLPRKKCRYSVKEFEQIKVPERDRDETSGLFFDSFSQATSLIPAVSWQLPQNDDTVPKTPAEKQDWVRRLVKAFMNTEGIEDKTSGPVITSRWLGRYGEKPDYYHEQIIELVCWEILTLTIKMYEEGLGWVPIYDQETWRKSEKEKKYSFKERMEALIALFSVFKNRCDKMIKGENIHVTILTPVEAKKTAKNNRTANDDRQAALKEGRKAQTDDGKQPPRKKRRAYRKNKGENTVTNSGANSLLTTGLVASAAALPKVENSEDDAEFELEGQELPYDAGIAKASTPPEAAAAEQTSKATHGNDDVLTVTAQHDQDFDGFTDGYGFYASMSRNSSVRPDSVGHSAFGGNGMDPFGPNASIPSAFQESDAMTISGPYNPHENSYRQTGQSYSQGEFSPMNYAVMSQHMSAALFPDGNETAFEGKYGGNYGEGQM